MLGDTLIFPCRQAFGGDRVRVRVRVKVKLRVRVRVAVEYVEQYVTQGVFGFR